VDRPREVPSGPFAIFANIHEKKGLARLLQRVDAGDIGFRHTALGVVHNREKSRGVFHDARD
jgi:hypothetical protein